MVRKTKIIATLGPATSTAEVVGELMDAGMDVARLNFSHGDHETHRRFAAWVRTAAEERQQPVALLQDIQGPKIRVGSFAGGETRLEAGGNVNLLPGEAEGGPSTVYVDYEPLLEDLQPGDQILMADGMIRLEATEVSAKGATARVVTGGVLRDRKGVALPQTRLRVALLSDKDRADLELGRELEVDYVAASFVRSGEDVRDVAALAEPGTPIIGKIELAVGYENLDDILQAAQGAMVARGDLGVELPLERIPLVQEHILRRTNEAGLLSITATEMLESMTSSPRPTRAEVTDVAHAVKSGTDAVMLSGETAVGVYPVRAVQMMDRICREVEAEIEEQGYPEVDLLATHRTFASATAKAAVEAAINLDLHTIVAFTETGSTARLLSKYRPAATIVAFTPVPATYRRMALFWGVVPNEFQRRDSTDLMIAAAEKHLEKQGVCERGEGVVMVAGIPPNQRASTNLMKLHVVGERSRARK